MQQQPNQTFSLTDLTGNDIDAIMKCLDEQPSKIGRLIMNKIEGQIIQQILLAQKGQAPAPSAPPPVDPSLAN